MSPRPKNPPPDRRREILNAALRVFARKGFAAATNAEIAKEAGVTAAAIYYYFSSKEELFQAAVSERAGHIGQTINPEMAEAMQQMPPEVVLPMVVPGLLSFFSDERTQAIIRILLSEGPRNPELVRVWQDQGINVHAPVLLAYLKAQAEHGRLPEIDPRVLGLMIAGATFLGTIGRDVLKLDLFEGLDNETMIRDLTAALLALLRGPSLGKE